MWKSIGCGGQLRRLEKETLPPSQGPKDAPAHGTASFSEKGHEWW
jgi:hypothetical protein